MSVGTGGGQTAFARSSWAAARPGVEAAARREAREAQERAAAAPRLVGVLCVCTCVHILDVCVFFKEAKTFP